MLGLSYEHRSQYRSERYVLHHSPNGGAASFPDHYYPQKSLPGLSPRQAEALGRHGPHRARTTDSESYIVSTPGTTPKQSLVPDFPSEHRDAQKARDAYANLVAAPVSPRPYGDYDELKRRPTAAYEVPIHRQSRSSPTPSAPPIDDEDRDATAAQLHQPAKVHVATAERPPPRFVDAAQPGEGLCDLIVCMCVYCMCYVYCMLSLPDFGFLLRSFKGYCRMAGRGFICKP